MFSQDRQQIRGFFVSTWAKFCQDHPLSPLEAQVAHVIAQHPEYHRYLNSDVDAQIPEGETNPFLHMGMHITLLEQISTDRPQGIRKLHQRLSRGQGDAHQIEHQMMECLGAVLWEAQRQNRLPDEVSYLACLRKLALK